MSARRSLSALPMTDQRQKIVEIMDVLGRAER
jgi:hypothetical protein